MHKILVNGAAGRMGQTVVTAIKNAADCELVGTADKNDNLTDVIQASGAEIVVDFTTAETAFDNVVSIINAGVHPVVGTSGLLPEQVDNLQQRCQQNGLGAVIAPNFSISAVIMMQLAAKAAPHFDQAEIIELHHDQKQDAPSGTAIKTAQMLHQANPELMKVATEKETYPHARGAVVNQIPVHAIRLAGHVAHEEIIFGSHGETLRLRHDSINRECFMPGVLLACRKVKTLHGMVYGLEHLLT